MRYILSAVLVSLALPAIALAAQSSSTHYQVNEVFFGSGGSLNSCSTNYCSKQSAGETAVGNASSANYQTQAGFNTDRTPYIEFTVGTTNINLGTLSANSTQTANADFSIKAYLTHGYSVVNASDSPVNNGYHLHALAIPSPSQAGVEQFGINLAANTDPVTFGADPTFGPDSSFASGQVQADYNTPNLYKYAKGDVIALSASSSSYTNYTISYIFNVSHVTPGGTYTMRHVLVATATY